MINLKLGFGRKELVIRFGTKKGRPKKTLFWVGQNFLLCLKRIYQDNRFRGNKISRVLRRVFETKKIKEVIGLNLAVVVFFSGTIGKPISAFTSQTQADTLVYTVNDVQTVTQESVRLPLNSFQISQGYHFLHPAIDLKEEIGAPVYSVMNGRVETKVHSRFGYGNYLIINHGSGFKSLYAHLGKITVEEGQEVNQKTVLGTVGTSGWTTGSHLHLEVWENDRPINPLAILK